MHLAINVKSPNNISKWQMGFNTEFKELNKQTGGHFITIKGNFIYQMSISIFFRARNGYKKYERIGGKQVPKLWETNKSCLVSNASALTFQETKVYYNFNSHLNR
jgi:hypothetical protein